MSAEKYNRYRETFLADQPHIEPSVEMLSLIESESMEGCGLYSVNMGDAICAVSHADPARVIVTELILNPVLKELSFDIDSEIGSMIARHFGSAETVFVTPGYGGCQGMIYGLPAGSGETDGESEDNEDIYEMPYYGFPVR